MEKTKTFSKWHTLRTIIYAFTHIDLNLTNVPVTHRKSIVQTAKRPLLSSVLPPFGLQENQIGVALKLMGLRCIQNMSNGLGIFKQTRA